MKNKGIIVCMTIFSIMISFALHYSIEKMIIHDTVYILQTGRYKDKENAQSMIKKLSDQKKSAYLIEKKDYLVLENIYDSQTSAKKQAQELSKMGFTCLVKDISIPHSYKKYISTKEINKLKEFID